ncbi:MAG TPA: sodium:proton antiporter [Baekduia sp.]|uniref:cation:proton antiporter n=1 Tax=Baekduia sp. TaxID=2600305 RepID=UPI002D7A11B9|nr:sodium:proton antiporter [Baekduia sp.]HET6510465.1 sodium:proton antiporter [Baekduia sp.]
MSGLQLLLVIVGAIAVTAYAQRRAAQPALVITLVGLAASFIPGIPRLELDTDIVLGVVLPPLLYSTALSFSVVAFLRKLGPILLLGVGLVIATTFAVGAVGAWVLPGLTGGAAIVLGAVVAPPDAVSAVAIGRELGLRRRVLSVLTGESLVNDAAALTLFSVAVASVTGSHTFVDNPFLLFLYSSVVGVVSGLAIGIVALSIRRVLNDAGLETVLGLVIPFAAYMLAEELEASGVLAVVTAGFLVGQLSVRFGYETRLQERQVWGAVDVLLETFVFAYMGLQLRFVIEDLQHAHESVPQVFGAGLLVLLAVIVIRPVWILLTLGAGLVVEDRPDDPAVVRAQRRLREANARAIARGRRTRPESSIEPLTLREAVVVSWTGMRGVVTLAAAAGIPLTLQSGAPFPGRAEIQAIAFLVAVGTLLLQGATLPWLIRRLGVQDPLEEEKAREQRRAAERIAHHAADEVYREFVASPPEGIDPKFVEATAQRLQRTRQASVDEAADAPTRGAAGRAIATLTRRVTAAQRAALVEAMRRGEVDDEAVRDLLETVDLQEAAIASRVRARL